MTKTIFEKSKPSQKAYSLPKDEDLFKGYEPPRHFLRKTEINLPEVSELEIIRHYSNLAHDNMSIDTHFYPLGSCTMKLNPKINDKIAQFSEFVNTHPFAPDESVQGNLEMMFELTKLLATLLGMASGSLLPNAGAQGEFVALKMIKAYHKDKGRDEIVIPDSAHGTNAASAAMAGYKTVTLKTNAAGGIDLKELREKISHKTAALMLTNPSTLGLFISNILEISQIVHENGALLYCDGANLNAILNIVRPGDMGFDVMHINLHKTFSTPHGGGGPGSGPIFCNEKLKPYLPLPYVEKQEKGFVTVWKNSLSIGKIASFRGNFSVYLRAYVYAQLHGNYGLRKIAEQAVLNANYLKSKFKDLFFVPYNEPCMHEFVVQADRFLDKGVKALDIAKRLLDYGIHAPTIYFPLIVRECLLIEPTESESKETLDQFIEVMKEIIKEIEENPEKVKQAPHTLSVKRLDEVRAAKHPILKNI